METTGSHGKNSRAGFWAHIVQVQYFTGSLVVKNLPATAGDAGSILGLGSSPGGGHGNPLQCSCPENPMDRGAWRARVQGVTKSRTQLSDWAHKNFRPRDCSLHPWCKLLLQERAQDRAGFRNVAPGQEDLPPPQDFAKLVSLLWKVRESERFFPGFHGIPSRPLGSKCPRRPFWERASSAPNLEVTWSEVAQSCLTLCNPVDGSPPGSSVHGVFQARILEGVTICFSRASSQPGDRTWVSHTAGRRFTAWATREAPNPSVRFSFHSLAGSLENITCWKLWAAKTQLEKVKFSGSGCDPGPQLALYPKGALLESADQQHGSH